MVLQDTQDGSWLLNRMPFGQVVEWPRSIVDGGEFIRVGHLYPRNSLGFQVLHARTMKRVLSVPMLHEVGIVDIGLVHVFWNLFW